MLYTKLTSDKLNQTADEGSKWGEGYEKSRWYTKEKPGDTYLLYVLQCRLGSFWPCFWYPEGSLDHLLALDTKEVQGPADKPDHVNLSFH